MADSQITVAINGKTRRIPSGCTIERLLAELELQSIGIAVEINSEIQSGTDFKTIVVNDGDRIEIVSLVGGG